MGGFHYLTGEKDEISKKRFATVFSTMMKEAQKPNNDFSNFGLAPTSN